MPLSQGTLTLTGQAEINALYTKGEATSKGAKGTGEAPLCSNSNVFEWLSVIAACYYRYTYSEYRKLSCGCLYIFSLSYLKVKYIVSPNCTPGLALLLILPIYDP
jgi:hypothetical protein